MKQSYTCDFCSKNFERYASKVKTRRVFCSRLCQKQSQCVGVLAELRTQQLKQYGVSSTLLLPNVHEKTLKTITERYGSVENLNDIIFQKRSKTMLETYGVCSSFQLQHVRQAAYIASASADARKKGHETLKRNKSYGKSKIEDRFYDLLCQHFGANDIQRQVSVNGRAIDFYVKSIDTYVQFDGVYWHGLDRPIEVIAEHRSQRDITIHNGILKDREQNEWFAEHSLRLIRVTDAQFKHDPTSTLLAITHA